MINREPIYVGERENVKCWVSIINDYLFIETKEGETDINKQQWCPYSNDTSFDERVSWLKEEVYYD